MTRREQLGTADKKGKKENSDDDECEHCPDIVDEDPSLKGPTKGEIKAKSKAGPRAKAKGKAKARGKREALAKIANDADPHQIEEQTGAEAGGGPEDKQKKKKNKGATRASPAQKSSSAAPAEKGKVTDMSEKKRESASPSAKEAASVAPDESSAKKKRKGQDGKALTFAARYCPSCPSLAARFTAIKEVFEEHVQPQIKSHSRHQEILKKTNTNSSVFLSLLEFEHWVLVCRTLGGRHAKVLSVTWTARTRPIRPTRSEPQRRWLSL